MDYEAREKLRNISVSTVERLLFKHKKKLKIRGTYGTKSGPPLKKRVTIPTHRECALQPPGFFQIDLVQHDGGEFINNALFLWRRENAVAFTKGRTGGKNDDCRVERKNYSTVRKTAGCPRCSGDKAVRALRDLYSPWISWPQPLLPLHEAPFQGAHRPQVP
jgi:hypothetical protein